MKSALVTGTAGFIGSQLADRLEREGWRVCRLTREVYDLAADVEGQRLSEIFDREKPEAVFHLASLFLSQHQVSDISRLVQSNILFGTRLLETISRKSNVEHPVDFISAGTGWQRLSKDDDAPVNLYAATKSAFFSITKFYSLAHRLRSCELRLFDTYGVGDPRRKVVKILMDSVVSPSGSPIDFSPGDQLLHMVHVRDVIDAFMQAQTWLKEQRFTTCSVFRVDSDALVSLKTLAAEIESVAQRKVSIKWGGRPYRDREVMRPYSEFERVPGWRPKIPLRQGLSELLRSLESEK